MLPNAKQNGMEVECEYCHRTIAVPADICQPGTKVAKFNFRQQVLANGVFVTPSGSFCCSYHCYSTLATKAR